MSRRLGAWILFIGLISLAGFTVGGAPQNALYKYSTAAGQIVQYGLFLLVTAAIAGWRTDLLALRQPRSWGRALAMAVPLFIATEIAISAIDRVLHGTREQGLVPQHWQPQHAGAYAANCLVVILVAPFVEELMFRGLGFSLLRRYGAWPAIVLVGLAFGLYHGLPRALPELALFGGALAWLRWKTDSVYPGMLVHATFNTIALMSVFF
jgi:membrane protease YdiL (CAAX protease family)